MPSPWFKFSRRYIRSPFFGKRDYDHVYIWMAEKASQMEHAVASGNRELVLRPGQFLTERQRAASELGLTDMQFRNRVKALQNNQLIDAKGTTRGTFITLIDPDTYEWQRGIYGIKRTSENMKKEPTKNQQRTTTLEDKDIIKKNYSACAFSNGDGGEDMSSDEIGPSSTDLHEASYSKEKDDVLSMWRREREAVGLFYVRSPKNDRAAVYAAAMIQKGDWSIEIIERAIKFLMAAPERHNYTLMGLLENIELWANGGSRHDYPNAGRKPSGANTAKTARRGAPADFSDVRTGEILG